LDETRAVRDAWQTMQSDQKEKGVTFRVKDDSVEAYVREVPDGVWLVHVPHAHNDKNKKGEYTYAYSASDDLKLVRSRCSSTKNDPLPAKGRKKIRLSELTGQITQEDG